MNIQNVEAFIYVHYFGTVHKAAEALFLSQPSVSSRIRTLEKELDVPLFERVGRNLVMTQEGKAFLPYAESIVQTYKNGQKRVKEKASIDHLHIGCTGLVAQYVMPSILPLFKKQHPHVQMTLHTGTTEEIEHQVLYREVDIGFVRTSAHASLERIPVLRTPIRLFVPSQHAFKGKRKIRVDELVREEIVFYECGSLDWAKVKNVFHKTKEAPSIAYEVDRLETAKELIVQGAGIGFLPEICVRKEVKMEEMWQVDLDVIQKESLKVEMIRYMGERSAYFDSFAELMKEIDRGSL